MGDLRRDGVIPRKVHVRNIGIERWKMFRAMFWVDDESMLAVRGIARVNDTRFYAFVVNEQN